MTTGKLLLSFIQFEISVRTNLTLIYTLPYVGSRVADHNADDTRGFIVKSPLSKNAPCCSGFWACFCNCKETDETVRTL